MDKVRPRSHMSADRARGIRTARRLLLISLTLAELTAADQPGCPCSRSRVLLGFSAISTAIAHPSSPASILQHLASRCSYLSSRTPSFTSCPLTIWKRYKTDDRTRLINQHHHLHPSSPCPSASLATRPLSLAAHTPLHPPSTPTPSSTREPGRERRSTARPSKTLSEASLSQARPPRIMMSTTR